MPRFTVQVQRPVWEYNEFEIDATNEQEARQKAQDKIDNCDFDDQFYDCWDEGDSEEMEISEIYETKDDSDSSSPASHELWKSLQC